MKTTEDQNGASLKRVVGRLARNLKWMWLTLSPPKAECPRCGTTAHVHRGRTDGLVTFRCFECLVKFDRHGNRYLWRKPPNVKLCGGATKGQEP